MTTLQTTFGISNYLTDGGLETDLIFNKGIDLPYFAAFPLVEQPAHQNILKNYYKDYLEIAAKNQMGFILESPTWRASMDWAYRLGYSKEDLVRVNQKAITLLKDLKDEYSHHISEILISGQLGPRGDGYVIDNLMSPTQASDYHKLQIRAFKESGADLISAITMTYVDEAVGIVQEAKSNDIQVVISFTVETDGNLPSGESLEEAISVVDAETDSYPIYYMINCAHPTHFMDKVEQKSFWKERIKGIRSNASCKSHAELDEATELDIGDKEALAKLHAALKMHLPNLKVFGGCCGTDASHVDAICEHIL